MTTSNITRTKAYKQLIAVGASDEQAKRLLAAKAAKTEAPKPAPKPQPNFEKLADELGLTVDEVKAALNEPEVEADAPTESTPEDLVAAAGFTFTKGRVYVNKDVVEGIARVLTTGSTEIIRTSGNGRTKAVLVTRLESGDASVQNLVDTES